MSIKERFFRERRLMFIKCVLLILIVASISACGGGGDSGGGDSSDSSPVANQAPILTLEEDQTVEEGASVVIPISASDSDGSISAIAAIQLSGPSIDATVTLQSLSFTAPQVNVEMVISLEVTVTDNDRDTATDTITFTVTPNVPPTIDLGSDLIVDEGEAVTVMVTATDTDGTITDIVHVQTTGTRIVDATISISPSPQFLRFTTPQVDQEETITISVTVTDNDGDTATDTITFTVTPNLPPTINLSPDLSPDLIVDEGEAVTVMLTATDTDGTITDIVHVQTTGTRIVDATISISPSPQFLRFTAPQVDQEETITISVTVTDNDGDTATDTITFTVTPNLPPTINLSPDLNPDLSPDLIVDEGEAVTVMLTATDTDGTITDIVHVQTTGTRIVDATISISPSPQFLRFTAPQVDQEETITISVTVTDNDGDTATDTITFTVTPTFELSGEIFPVEQSQVDVDVNDASRQYIKDPNTVFESNNKAVEAQMLPNPVILNGFVSKVPTGSIDGATGNFENSADPDDYFSVDLLAGQFVSLRLADFDSEDPQSIDFDLMLYDTNSELVVHSMERNTSVESVGVGTEGQYTVRVNAFAGTGKYVLHIGNTSLATGLKAYGESADFIPGEAIVQLRDMSQMLLESSHGKPELEKLNLSHTDVDRAGLLSFPYRKPVKFADRKQSLIARIHNRNMDKHDSLARIKSLKQREDIEFVEPNYRVHAMAIPNDEFYHYQSHYSQIRLPQAWDLTTGTPETGYVIVAVVDTGVVLQHEDLASKLVSGYDFISDPKISADGDGIDNDPSDPSNDSSWHGTHVSGIVAAATNNDIGVAGVSWDARIMPIRVLGVGGGSSYDLLQGVRYAAGLSNDSGTVPAQTADIINLSLVIKGGGVFSQSAQDTYNEIYDAGILVIAAAGNKSTSVPSYPASYAGVISVSAVDLLGNLAPYSNFGDTVDVTAPGGNLLVDSDDNGKKDGVLSTQTVDNNGESNYQFFEGTSIATPHVSGVAALMKAVYPAMTAADFTAGLMNGALTQDIGNVGRDNSYGHGLIDALAAVQYAMLLAGGEVAGAILIEPKSLDFGKVLVSRNLSLTTIGNKPPSVSSIASSESWLTVEAKTVDEGGIGIYNVTINRMGLADSTYSGVITFVLSNTTEWVIPVSMTVETGSDEGGDAGFQFVLLLDADSEELVAQQNVDLVNGRYRYNFSGVPTGEYFVLTGSDIDNNLLICELGESCGGYPTLNQFVRVNIDKNISGLDFLVSIIANLVGSASDAKARPRKGVSIRFITKEEPTND